MRGVSRYAVLCLGLGMTAAGCAARAQSALAVAGGLPPQRGDTAVDGTVTAVGADPFSQVVVATTNGDVAALGVLLGEVGALQGAVVRIWGAAVANRQPVPARAVDVRGYDVVGVGGERVYVGVLVRRSDALWIEGRDTLRLEAVPAALGDRLGAKVWVGGARRGEGVEVRLFGVIRYASPR